MNESKPYKLPEDESWMAAEAVAPRMPVDTDIKSLRHDLTDAIYATDNQQLLYSCLVFLNNQNSQESDLKEKMLARITDLELLENGWDGEGSLAINPTSLNLSRKVVLNVTSELLEDWVLFPDARGFVYWDYTHGKNLAGITIAPNKMVAFVKKNGQLHKYSFDKVEFSKIINILEEVHG